MTTTLQLDELEDAQANLTWDGQPGAINHWVRNSIRNADWGIDKCQCCRCGVMQ